MLIRLFHCLLRPISPVKPFWGFNSVLNPPAPSGRFASSVVVGVENEVARLAYNEKALLRSAWIPRVGLREVMFLCPDSSPFPSVVMWSVTPN